MASQAKVAKCENPNCGRVAKRLRTAGVAGKGAFRLCGACYECARKHGKLRPADLVERAEGARKRRETGKRVCENPSCGKACKLRSVMITGQGRFWLCPKCSWYAREHNQLRSAETVKAAEELRARQSKRGNRCHNPNCRTTQLDQGRYGKDNGKYYCHACGVYRNEHGSDRPKQLVDAQKRISSSGRGFGECENPSCRKVVKQRSGFEFEKEGWLRLCGSCRSYACIHNKLRSAEMVEKAETTKKRFRSRDKCCFNKNCRTTLLEGGGYGKHNNEFYCHACAVYVNNHNGEERPKSSVDASTVHLEECENPNCGTMASRLTRTEVDGEGSLRLCKACNYYTHMHKTLRSLDVIEKAAIRKRRRTGDLQCHNANCHTANLFGGGYAKCNGEYYCRACKRYVDNHDGEERPKKLVDEANLRHSRYMWMLHHPDIPSD